MGMAIGSSSAVAYALQGIDSATAAFNSDAQSIASGSDIGSMAGAMVDMTQQNLAVQVDVRMLALANKTLGSLLDVSA